MDNESITGFFNIYKEAGFTSFDVVAKLRGILHIKKIGHMGTLDPAAEGVLPVAVGRATKALSLLSDHSKAYRATLLLGVLTDTYDTSGREIERREVSVTENAVRETVASFVGDQLQIPPMYSAKRVNGKHLYELAREGKEVERKPVSIHIADITIVDITFPFVTLDVSCSKGTYIRSLCHDIGKALGCGGCMDDLCRTRAGRFFIEDAHQLSDIEQARDEGRITELLLPLEEAFGDLPKVNILPAAVRGAVNGNPLTGKDVEEKVSRQGWVRLHLPDGRLVGIYEVSGDRFTLKKMLYEE